MIKTVILTLVVLIAIPVLVMTTSKIGVEGYVTEFDNNTVTIESGSPKIEILRALEAPPRDFESM